MSFHETRFPTAVSFGAIGGPERRTEIVTLANGFEERNSSWAHSRRRYDAGKGIRDLRDIEMIIAFFEARGGALHGFRWKDWSDYKSAPAKLDCGCEDQPIGHGDGETRLFALSKCYESAGVVYKRPITKPCAGSVTVGVEGDRLREGQDFELDCTTGAIRFVNAPPKDALVTAGFEFDVPVRFDTDNILVSIEAFGAGQLPSIPVVELRV